MNLYGSYIPPPPREYSRAFKWCNAIKFRKETAEADLVEQIGVTFSELCFAVIDRNSDNDVCINELKQILGKNDAQLLMSVCDADASLTLNVRIICNPQSWV